MADMSQKRRSFDQKIMIFFSKESGPLNLRKIFFRRFYVILTPKSQPKGRKMVKK